MGVNRRGDTCVKPLPGNSSAVTFSELLGTGSYKDEMDQRLVFRGGKLDAKEISNSDCGCPATMPVMQAQAQPSPTPVPPKDNNAIARPTERVAVASNEPTSPLPPDRPGQIHIEVDAPFVFNARGTAGQPYSVAKVQFSSLPNVYFLQEKVDPIVLREKPPEVSLKAEAAVPLSEEKLKKPKKGFMGRVKGFFGSLFHR
jgi:hypothetical protein